MKKKVTCQKHKDYVKNYNGSLKELAEDIGNLKYDALEVFLKHLSKKLYKDSNKDFKNNKNKLSKQLFNAAMRIEFVIISIKKAWEISKPFMEKNKK